VKILANQNYPWFRLMALALAFSALLAGVKPGLAGPAGPICHGRGLKKQVALTFDDGPHPSFTIQILSLLNKYAAQATFFVLGEHAAQYPEVIRELVDSGQEVGNHSFTHLRFPSKDEEAWPGEIERTELELDLLGCPDHGLFRAPYSDYNPGLLQFLANIGQRLVLWSVDAADWREPDPMAITVNVVSQVEPGSIVVMHDSDETGEADRTPTVEALGLILPALLVRGYQCVTVSELLAVPAEPDQAKATTSP
jgi:peptidoglycan/xylan/chitin deacetylase (PgdA/CDA1 family)